MSAFWMSACGTYADYSSDPDPSKVLPLGDPIKSTRYSETDLSDLDIPVGNYSGITYMGGNRYAVTDDKAKGAGFVYINFSINSSNGKLSNASRTVPEGTIYEEFTPSDWEDPSTWKYAINDAEGIVFYPKNNSIFIACEEGHQGPRIIEYDLNGKPTGRCMEMPDEFRYITDERGTHYNWNDGEYDLESLTYNEKTGLFWTTTEQSLRSDKKEGEESSLLRLQSFDEDLKPASQYLYSTDENETKDESGYHIWGVADLLALDDGRLIVMEREFSLTNLWCNVKLYVVDPTKAKEGDLLKKTILKEFKTSSSLTDGMFADYEGMCLGPRLNNGKQTLILIADSDNGKGFLYFKLHDAVKVLTIE